MKRVHFMGIGGSGASAVAAIARAQGFKVTGCDRDPSTLRQEFTRGLRAEELYLGHDPKHLEGVDILAISPAILSFDPTNVEVEAAKRQRVELMTWQEFMGKYLEEGKEVIAVCGTHGKSTTTAMIAKILSDTGLNPTVELGAVMPEWGTNYRVGHGKYFVTEADEFNNNFLVTRPDIALVTTIEFDHPEFFKSIEDVKTSFVKFLSQTKRLIVANLADPNVAQVIKEVMKQSKATCLDYSKSDFGLKLQIPGEYNQMNAAAAFQVALSLGLSPEKIRQSLANYQGIGRRQELVGKVNGAMVFSDFGHHPTAIKVTVEAIKQAFPDKTIWVVFQPHMFSRTKALFDQFVSVLTNLPVEGVSVLDIYASREIDTGLVSSQELVETIDKPGVKYVPNFPELAKELRQRLTNQDIVIFIGAGNIDQLAREFASSSIEEEIPRLNALNDRVDHKSTKVLVVGFGVEGQALTNYFLDQGAVVTVADMKLRQELASDQVEVFSSRGVHWINGAHYLDSLTDFELVAFSPGVKYPVYQKIVNSGVEWTTQMRIFFDNSPTHNLIGVTGTKGKGTTSTLIYQILKEGGLTVHLAGNIGAGVLPLLKILKADDWVVLELSSYQLRDLEKSPHIGIILNITPDHMDVHPNFDDYISAKANVIRFQSEIDYALLNSEYELTRKLADQTKGQVKYFSKQDFVDSGFELRIPGEHNFENAAAALKVAELLGIDRQVASKVLREFKGLPHRLELVAEIKGVKFIDDSFATSVGPTMVAIRAFKQPKILILGGSGKIDDFSQLVTAIGGDTSVKEVITIGKTGLQIGRELQEAGFGQVVADLKDINEVVNRAFKDATPGEVVLLSPADASFDWFKNYTDRGEKFKEAVNQLTR